MRHLDDGEQHPILLDARKEQALIGIDLRNSSSSFPGLFSLFWLGQLDRLAY